MIILVAACATSISKTSPISTSICSNNEPTLSSFLAITPNLTSQSEVESLLGVANGTEEPLLTEWTWIYLCNADAETRLRVTFDTSTKPLLVMKMNYYKPKINVAELINTFGSPELVYKENFEHQTEEGAEYTFAYPTAGFFAFVMSTSMPTSSDEVLEFLRETSQNPIQFLADVGEQKNLEIIEWP